MSLKANMWIIGVQGIVEFIGHEGYKLHRKNKKWELWYRSILDPCTTTCLSFEIVV